MVLQHWDISRKAKDVRPTFADTRFVVYASHMKQGQM